MQNVGLDPEFIDAEDIVAKLHFLEHLESRWPYQPAKGVPLSARVTRCLECIPSEWRRYALAAFANAVYLPDALLRESWSYLAGMAARHLDTTVPKLFEQCHVLEVDPCGLVFDFLHENRVQGRLDVDRFSRLASVDDVARTLLILGTPGAPMEGAAKEILLAFRKPYWLVLADNVLSGTSLQSDLVRCRMLIDAYAELGSPEVVPLVQVLTSAAEAYAEGEWEITSALRFDERFRIVPDSQECSMFARRDTLDGVIGLCRWLTSQPWFAEDERLLATLSKSGDDMALGFKAGGWTIVTPNCPTNSLPILWYHKQAVYEGPFPRIMSRTSQARGSGKELTDAAVAAAPRVLARIGGDRKC